MLRPGRARSGRAHPHTAPCRVAAALALGPALLWLPPVTMATRARRRRGKRVPGVRAAREGAASVARPGGDVAGGAQSWARLGPRPDPLPGPCSYDLQPECYGVGWGRGIKGEKTRDAYNPSPDPGGHSCTPFVPHALSPGTLDSCCSKLGPQWPLPPA